jgi:hypothetical protein
MSDPGCIPWDTTHLGLGDWLCDCVSVICGEDLVKCEVRVKLFLIKLSRE